MLVEFTSIRLSLPDAFRVTALTDAVIGRSGSSAGECFGLPWLESAGREGVGKGWGRPAVGRVPILREGADRGNLLGAYRACWSSPHPGKVFTRARSLSGSFHLTFLYRSFALP